MKPSDYAKVANRVMAERLMAGKAVDLSAFALDENGRYVIPTPDWEAMQHLDLCNARTEAWIWTVGRRKADGVVLASHSAELYQNPEFDCLFLR